MYLPICNHYAEQITNKPGTAQVGAIFKARKRKPLFLQLETTKALKKLKIEEKKSFR